MTEFLLIRHGDNDFLTHHKLPGHLPGIHLNRRGTAQAQEIDKALNQLPVKAIYTSPLERALDTAAPLAASLGLEIQVRPGLIDLDVGEWAGRSWKMLGRTKLWKILQKEPAGFRFPGGETFIAAQDRVVATLEAIASLHQNEMVAVVFHADPIKLAVAYYLGMPFEHFQRLTIATGSVTILRLNNKVVRLQALNLIPPFNLSER